MKKLGLLLLSTILLSGCTSTNGILSKKDLMDESMEGNYEVIENIVKEQKNVVYIPDDVKDFISKTKTDDLNEPGMAYLNINLQDINNIDIGGFMQDIYYGGRVEKSSKDEFEKFVGILDETISRGIKLYLDKNMNADLKDGEIYTNIGRVWICISPLDKEAYYGHEDYTPKYGETVVDVGADSEDEITKNEVRLMIKVKDIKDEKYKKIVDSFKEEDLMVDSINVGKDQDLIQLRNIESKLYGEARTGLKSPAINYQLFMKDKEVSKVRMFISSMENKEINDDLASLTKLSDKLEFNLEDNKQLEEMKMIIKENKRGKKTLSSERFNFSYRNLESEEFKYGAPEKVSIAELVIQKRK